MRCINVLIGGLFIFGLAVGGANGLGGTAGGWTTANVTDQGVQNASLFAVAQLAQQDNSVFLYQLGSVLQASSQVVAGTNYNITLIAQLTNCLTNSSGNSVACTATSQKTCVVIVWYQAWMTPPMKLTNSSCTSWTTVQTSSTPSSNNSASLSTSPEGIGKGDLPGGWNNINVSDPGVQNASLFAVKQLAQQSNDMYSYQLGSIIQASVQVVAGFNYNLTLNIQKTNCLSSAQNSGSCTAMSEETCVVIVWFQSWRTPSMKLTSFSCSSWTAVQQSIGSQSTPVGDSSILPTSSPPEVEEGDLPGGWSDIGVDDEGVKSASLFAVGELAQQNNSTFLYQLGKILQSSVQVVAGANYNITLTVQLTNCLINSTANSSSCTATSQETCVVIVWFQSWMSPSMQLTSFSCSSWTAVQPVRSPTPQISNSTVPPTSPSGTGMGSVLGGGWSNVDVADQRVQNASFFAVGELARQNNSPFFYQLGGVQQASSQVVSGTNYNITLLVFLTNCPTNSSAKFVSCTITSQETCVVIVWVQPWMTPSMKLTNSLCSPWTSVLSNSTSNVSDSSSTMRTNRSLNGTVGTTPATSSTTSDIAVQVSSSGSSLLSNSSTPPGKSTTIAASDNIPGGWSNANVTDQRVQNASLFAVGELARQNNSLLLYQLGEIQQASSQTVSGVNWNITLVVQVTNCSITTNNSTGSCVAKYQETCVVIVLVQAWMSPPMKLTSSSCTPWTAIQNLRANGTTRLRLSESYLYIICIAIISKVFLSNY